MGWVLAGWGLLLVLLTLWMAFGLKAMLIGLGVVAVLALGALIVAVAAYADGFTR